MHYCSQSVELEVMQSIFVSQGMQYSVFKASEEGGTEMVMEVYYQFHRQRPMAWLIQN